MEQAVFEKFRKIVYAESGIVLSQEKLALLAGRIQKRLRALGLGTESEYLQIIETDASGEELQQLIDVVSTNVTYFYREPNHFVMLREIVANMAKAGKRELKVWCAAASSGEEPYTIAFEVLESLTPPLSGFRMLATDICTKVLNKATSGIYPEKALEKVPENIRGKYMREVGDDEGSWQVRDHVAKMILFKKLNLVQHPYPVKGPFDIIFCRNVMIYFDLKTRTEIVGEMQGLLAQGGYLFLSNSENLLGIEHRFAKLGASVFRKD